MTDNQSTHGYHRYRRWVSNQHASVLVAHKAGVILVGVVVILVGIILIPLPGPGWLIVFFGVSILGLEFPFFGRVTAWVSDRAKRLWSWLKLKLGRR